MKVRCLFVAVLLCLGFDNVKSQTILEKVEDRWTLKVDGQPFDIKGATFGYNNDPENYDHYFKDLKFLGVNTIRTWGVDENTKKLLDTAHKDGIKVMLGIWMRHGRPGREADDSFDYINDNAGKEAMFNDAIAIVEEYKNHPAVLTWGIGNEVYLNIATDAEKLAYSILLERICKEIKRLDSNHPVTSVEAWTFGLDWWQKHVPSIDIYGLNSYGPGANLLEDELKKRGIDKPYVLTEFNIIGEWDIKPDVNGVIPEPTDKEKYTAIVNGYQEWIKPKASCLGVYVFHYANNDDFGAIWLLSHFQGLTRPTYWAIREAYTGEKPVNHIPAISKIGFTDEIYQSGSWGQINLEVRDVENENLDISFYYNQRTGSRKRRDQLVQLNSRGSLDSGYEIQLPQEYGGIKVYVMAKDQYNNVGIASTSILVEDEEAKNKEYLVPKAGLPFYIYKDNESSPYIPSALMGNYQAIEIDLDYTEEVYEGSKSIKIHYKDKSDWYGVGFVDPPGDWGEILGGYDITDAETLSFWAKASYDNLKVTAGFGLIKNDKPFPDTAIETVELSLTSQWKKYVIKTKKLDMSCIRSGFVIFSSGEGLSHTIYLDEIVFE